MTTALTIAELARRTGLTSRTLRFYDARALVVAQRTSAGGRVYGPAEVARLHQVTALKRAGFALTQIGTLLGGQPLDLGRLIDAQLETLGVERDRIDEAVASLRTARTRLDAGGALDVETFCTLIKQGETAMTNDAAWKKVADRYFTPEEQAHWAERKRALMPANFDGDAYQAAWAELGSRIGAALPMDPASVPAQAFLAEWNALLEPFKLVADARMATQTVSLYDRMDEWSGEMSPGFTKPVWEFIKAAAVAKPA